MHFEKIEAADITPPTMETAESAARDKPLYISVTKDGAYFFGKDEVGIDELGTRLKKTAEEEPSTSFILTMDEAGELKYYINVLDKARLAGVKKLSIQALKKIDE